MKKFIMLSLSILLLPIFANARVTPIMFSLFDPVQVPSSDFDVRGIRINLIYSDCENFKGLDIGFVNSTKTAFNGWGIGFINMANDVRGWQLGGINSAEVLRGLQIGVVNFASSAYGLQIGLVNIISDNDFPFLPIINGTF